jgi:hypothetical protein
MKKIDKKKIDTSLQNFNNYLLDIAKQDGYNDNLKQWIDTLELQTLMDYADDYAKDCMRKAKKNIDTDIEKQMDIIHREYGTSKHDWCYEDAMGIVDKYLK